LKNKSNPTGGAPAQKYNIFVSRQKIFTLLCNKKEGSGTAKA
jgi:hypothetical protein